jgi:AmmeMemoRadiSam system protein B
MNSLASALNIVFEPIIDETLFVISSNSSNHADSRVSKMQFERFKSLVQEKNGIKLLDDYKANNMSACGIVSIAAMLESGLLDKSAAVQVPYSDASIIDVDGKTVCFTALNFSEKADPLESFMDRRQGDRRKPGH